MMEAPEAPAEIKSEAPSRRGPKSGKVNSRMLRFVRAYTHAGNPTYLNGTNAAIAAGYGKNCAAGTACRLLANPHLRSLIDARERSNVEREASLRAVSIEMVKSEHLRLMQVCEDAEDYPSATRNLECLGKTVGAYDTTLHVDVTVKHEYDERLAIEASAVARIRLEDAGAAGLGMVVRTVEAEVKSLPPASDNGAYVALGQGEGRKQGGNDAESKG